MNRAACKSALGATIASAVPPTEWEPLVSQDPGRELACERPVFRAPSRRGRQQQRDDTLRPWAYPDQPTSWPGL